MHHDILALLDAHLTDLRAARDQLGATRRVTPGERRTAALHAAEAGERFAAQARILLAELEQAPDRPMLAAGVTP